MKLLRICIVEDEKKSQDDLQNLIRRFEAEENIKCAVTVFGDGMNFISDYRPVYDIIFMDIEMPFMNGMNAAKKMRELDPDVSLIFVTHLTKYALQGYEVDAVGYLLKPAEYFSLSRRLKKAIARREFSAADDILVKSVDGLVKIERAKLRYVEIIDHFLIWHTVTADHKAYGRLSDAEELLSAPHFFKCNKSYIVNFGHIDKLTKTSVFIDGEEILVSRSRQKELLGAFNRYVGGTIDG